MLPAKGKTKIILRRLTLDFVDFFIIAMLEWNDYFV
jgi:hypothetical protein